MSRLLLSPLCKVHRYSFMDTVLTQIFVVKIQNAILQNLRNNMGPYVRGAVFINSIIE